MKAIVQDRFGPPEVLRLADTDLPEVGADDVLVQVHAAALNPAGVPKGTAAEVSGGGMPNVLICAPMLSHQQRTSRRAERRIARLSGGAALHAQ